MKPVLVSSQDHVLSPDAVMQAQRRIAPHVHRTPLLECELLNTWLGHDVVFKAEGFQKIGAFKIRGALNALLHLREQGRLPEQVVAFSSGNHAQAVALACRMLGIRATVFMPRFVSAIKQQATKSYGADLILTETRQEAESRAQAMEVQGALFLHPSAHDDVIAGQGTATLEAMQDGGQYDAVFAACGGGGLVSGAWLAANGAADVYAAEPAMANDVAQSLKAGHIVGFDHTPMSIADGARTLKVSEVCFPYLKRLAGVCEVEETTIIYWTQWLSHLLKVSVEPTAALAMGAAAQWLGQQANKKRVLVLLSGGNVDAASMRAIWERSYLEQVPGL